MPRSLRGSKLFGQDPRRVSAASCVARGVATTLASLRFAQTIHCCQLETALVQAHNKLNGWSFERLLVVVIRLVVTG